METINLPKDLHKSNTNRFENWWTTDVAKGILEAKYYHTDKDGTLEDFPSFLQRVSGIFSEELREPVRTAILNGDFLPAGRTLYAAGADKDGFKASYSSCYILPMPEDNIESIFDTMKQGARISSAGGGIGLSISKLRPKGAKVRNSAKTSSGSVSFIPLFDSMGSVIGSNGRRNAMMIGLDCSHPDLEDFLEIKQNNTAIQNANLSILFTDEFMRAVRDNEEYNLEFQVEATGELICKSINAREFFMKFAENNHTWGEPKHIWA